MFTYITLITNWLPRFHPRNSKSCKNIGIKSRAWPSLHYGLSQYKLSSVLSLAIKREQKKQKKKLSN